MMLLCGVVMRAHGTTVPKHQRRDMGLLKGQSTVKLFRELFIGADGTDYLRGIQLLYSEPGWPQTDPAV